MGRMRTSSGQNGGNLFASGTLPLSSAGKAKAIAIH